MHLFDDEAHVIESAGHAPFWTDADEFNPLLTRFLSTVAGRQTIHEPKRAPPRRYHHPVTDGPAGPPSSNRADRSKTALAKGRSGVFGKCRPPMAGFGHVREAESRPASANPFSAASTPPFGAVGAEIVEWVDGQVLKTISAQSNGSATGDGVAIAAELMKKADQSS